MHRIDSLYKLLSADSSVRQQSIVAEGEAGIVDTIRLLRPHLLNFSDELKEIETLQWVSISYHLNISDFESLIPIQPPINC